MIWEVQRVKVELSHNPYLLETGVKFNGREPKINSLVEKYKSGKLQSWISKIPDIFYNEMNGWDFDLDFSGTKIDFEYLQAAFDNVGVSRESVRLFHKNEVKDVERKRTEIFDLLSLLENSPNRQFAYADFSESNAHLFDSGYSFVVVQGPLVEPAFDEITVENVSNIAELEQAALDNTPILFYVNEQNRREFIKNLADILSREDVMAEQLFFSINSDLNCARVERVIKDLGVECPQIVESPSDSIIKRYLEVYPMTAHIQHVIDVLRNIQSEIGAVLQAQNEQGIIKNDTIHQKIDKSDEILRKLKNTSEKIAQRDNFESPAGLYTAKRDFIQKVVNWQKKKISMNSDAEASIIATEFVNDINTFFKEFISQIGAEFQNSINDIDNNFLSTYSSADFDDNYMANQEHGIYLSGYTLPALAPSVLKLKSEKYVERNDSPFGLFKNMLGNTPQQTAEPVRVVTYLYQEWRVNAAALASPILDYAIQRVNETLRDYYERVAIDYLEHLKELIKQQIQIKNGVSAQLSDDERKLQSDNDWFTAFQEKLREIERG
jgi:hypothetical protein